MHLHGNKELVEAIKVAEVRESVQKIETAIHIGEKHVWLPAIQGCKTVATCGN